MDAQWSGHKACAKCGEEGKWCYRHSIPAGAGAGGHTGEKHSAL